MRWAIPRARVPSGEAVGGSWSLQATPPAAAHPRLQPFSTGWGFQED